MGGRQGTGKEACGPGAVCNTVGGGGGGAPPHTPALGGAGHLGSLREGAGRGGLGQTEAAFPGPGHADCKVSSTLSERKTGRKHQQFPHLGRGKDQVLG